MCYTYSNPQDPLSNRPPVVRRCRFIRNFRYEFSCMLHNSANCDPKCKPKIVADMWEFMIDSIQTHKCIYYDCKHDISGNSGVSLIDKIYVKSAELIAKAKGSEKPEWQRAVNMSRTLRTLINELNSE